MSQAGYLFAASTVGAQSKKISDWRLTEKLLLSDSILATIAYFDLFDYPLTIPELYRYLWLSPATTLEQVTAAIQALSQLTCQAGLVYLTGRDQLAQTRHDRYLESERKFRKRHWFLQLLSFVPGVEAICIVNTLAYHNVRADSDIDLLIVTTPGKIWSTRFFTTALAKLFEVRPRPGKTADAVCLSFYCTSDQLNFSQLSRHAQDIHQAYWLAQIRPIYDPHNLMPELWTANRWVKELLPNAEPLQLHYNRIIKATGWQKIAQLMWGVYLWEWLWKPVQLAVLPKKLKGLSGPANSAVVVLSDTLLKFHTYDPRPELEQKWRDKLYGLRGSKTNGE